MTQPVAPPPSGFLSFTFHAHLPLVVHHGTWPHGLEWLLEAAAETYLPLLRMYARLERDGIPLRANLNLTPILLEQLAHPSFQAEFPRYLERKVQAAREDEAYFNMMGEGHYAELARVWQRFFSEAAEEFAALGGNLVAGFRGLEERGQIEIITSGATHGYLPLIGTDESVRAQVRMAVKVHERHLGRKPRGIWAPECGYRPAGAWRFPAGTVDGGEAVDRIGVEEAIAEAGLEYFFADTHLVQGGTEVDSPYFRGASAAHVHLPEGAEMRRLYQPYFVDGPYSAGTRPATVFPRDARTGAQVWSSDTGYPGDGEYLDFHKKRWPGGHRYWRVTGAGVDIGDKQPYHLEAARERIREHARHFVELVWGQLQQAMLPEMPPPILSAPFDAELFGHWWFEGPEWLEAVAREVHARGEGLATCTASEYLDQFARAGSLAMAEGSWGLHGSNEVWLNGETEWTYRELYPAELRLRELASGERWKSEPEAARVLKQMCRELMLMESSDWQFLITTGAARDYASARFHTHADGFAELSAMWDAAGALNDEQRQQLEVLEGRDDVFADVDPAFWAKGAHAGLMRAHAAEAGVAVEDATVSEVVKFQTGAEQA